jgi:hypothetical protein
MSLTCQTERVLQMHEPPQNISTATTGMPAVARAEALQRVASIGVANEVFHARHGTEPKRIAPMTPPVFGRRL